MELFETLKQRYSVRAYKDRPVPEEALRAVLQAANDAPSAGNLQPFEIIVVRDAETRRALAKTSYEQWFVAEAPVVLVFFSKPDRNREKFGQLGVDFFAVQDATIACAYSLLAATAVGLGTCWIGAFHDQEVRDLTGAPESWRPVAILPVGYPADTPKPRERRALDDLVHEGKART
jgi:nitroreductase